MKDIFLDRRAPSNAHHHELKVKRMVADGRLPMGTHLVDVSHDLWCDLIAGRGFCNCAPEITLKPVPKLS
jgi:hypothetical protein